MNLLLASLLWGVSVAQHLACYHCMSRMSVGGDSKQEQNMLKTSLFERFNVPPSSEYCADGGDGVLFRTVAKEKCGGVNDTCVRIILSADETRRLVLRGCQSSLFKPQFEVDTNFSCGAHSDCISTCQTPLCNSSNKAFSVLVFLFVYMIY